MATMNFPTSPAVNDTYTFGGATWIWNGTGWAQQAALVSGLPSQTGNSGKYLTTDGSNASWSTVAGGDPTLSTYRSGVDGNGIYTVITYKRADGTNYKVSTLSGGSSPAYTTRTVDNYGADGTTVTSTQVYTLTYADGVNLSQEVLN
jgi:hypothetical protein